MLLEHVEKLTFTHMFKSEVVLTFNVELIWKHFNIDIWMYVQTN
jgi:hypothetical protein